MVQNLNGLSVLVTRPVDQAEALVAAIEAAGGLAQHCPVMEIVALDQHRESELIESNKHKILALDNYHHIIVISSNAAYAALELIDDYWPQLPLGLQWHAVGSTTAALLKSRGIAVSSCAGKAMNSEALLQQGPLQQLSNNKIVIARGVGGREYLRQQLQSRGATVDYLECYRRQLAATSAQLLQQQLAGVDAICLNSAESVDYFASLAGAQLSFAKALPVVVPSVRVADHAEKNGYSRVIVAQNASNLAVVAALKTVAVAAGVSPR
ncbi:MAG: uroporphyrinogen-III synthase [Paraglaciecola psychrophila]|jgi:uroporphyrinogen-III synthase